MSEPWDEADLSAATGPDLPLGGLLEELLQGDDELLSASAELTASQEELPQAADPCAQDSVPMPMEAMRPREYSPPSWALQVFLRLPARRWPPAPGLEEFVWGDPASEEPAAARSEEPPPQSGLLALEGWLAARPPESDAPVPERLLRPLRVVMMEIDRELDTAPALDLTAHRDVGRHFERFLVFQIGSVSLAVPLEQVLEVDRVPRVTQVPGSPPHWCGLVNLRGEIVPLLDLRAMLELPAPPSNSAGRLVVVRAWDGEAPCAVRVDALGGIAVLDTSSLEAPPVELDSHIVPWVAGSSAHRNRPVQLFDLSRLLAAQPEWAAEA